MKTAQHTPVRDWTCAPRRGWRKYIADVRPALNYARRLSNDCDCYMLLHYNPDGTATGFMTNAKVCGEEPRENHFRFTAIRNMPHDYLEMVRLECRVKCYDESTGRVVPGLFKTTGSCLFWIDDVDSSDLESYMVTA